MALDIALEIVEIVEIRLYRRLHRVIASAIAPDDCPSNCTGDCPGDGNAPQLILREVQGNSHGRSSRSR